MYHKELVKRLCPHATVRAERSGQTTIYYLHEAPDRDARRIGGGANEQEAWVVAALTLLLNDENQELVESLDQPS